MLDESNDIYSNYSFLLEKTGKRIRQYAKRKFRDHGFAITIDQWSVLKAIYQTAPVSQVDLAQYCHKDTPTLTRILDILVQKKLATRNADSHDRRKQLVELTAEGSQMVMSMLPHVRNIRMQAWQHLDAEDFQHFVRILHTIYQNLED